MSTKGPKTGVLLMAHGTPARMEDLTSFVTDLRRGRPPEPQLIDELARRYEAIGGTSPLAERSRWHAGSLGRVLEEKAPGQFTVELGYKFAAPRIEDSVGELARRGVERVIGLVLAPHYSAMSIGDYARRAEEAAQALDPPIEISTVPEWHLAPGFVPLMADLVRSSLAGLPDHERFTATAVFTAHSLPERIVENGDPYPEQLQQSAAAISAAADVERFMVAWQSAGRTADKWLGPDVLDVIAELPATGSTAVLVCPVGFVSEHLEVLYDLDVEAKAAADKAGIRFARTPSLDYDPRLTDVLAGIVLGVANSSEGVDVASSQDAGGNSSDEVGRKK